MFDIIYVVFLTRDLNILVVYLGIATCKSASHNALHSLETVHVCLCACKSKLYMFVSWGHLDVWEIWLATKDL